jgi:pyrroloquinoline quinone (PQQ) biosynthesis protein C
MVNDLDHIETELVGLVEAHPFLARCRAGKALVSELMIFLDQHELYGRHFTRLLCALMSNLKDSQQISALGANLFEELGFDSEEAVPHSVLYRQMLAAFGRNDPERSIPLPGTRQLVDVMYAHCRAPDLARGLGALCLGAEALVPSMYADLVAGFEAVGFGDRVDFFRIHIACDDGHADTMRAILHDLVREDPGKRAVIEDAGRAAVGARLAFLDSIERAALDTRAAGGEKVLRTSERPPSLVES